MADLLAPDDSDSGDILVLDGVTLDMVAKEETNQLTEKGGDEDYGEYNERVRQQLMMDELESIGESAIKVGLDDGVGLDDELDDMVPVSEPATPGTRAQSERTGPFVPDEIPITFTSMDEWPRRTNLLCWYCGMNFDSIPVFVPLSMTNLPSGTTMGVHGNFCSFNCAVSEIAIDEGLRVAEWDYTRLLCRLYRLFMGEQVRVIAPALAKRELAAYGGTMSAQEWRLHAHEQNITVPADD
jgi:hypothetical protein